MKIQIGVVMGSSSDWDTLQHAVHILQQFGVVHESRVVSAHRMPDDMFAYAQAASERGLQAIIAGAGGAAHLPGMLAAKTPVPVLASLVMSWRPIASDRTWLNSRYPSQCHRRSSAHSVHVCASVKSCGV